MKRKILFLSLLLFVLLSGIAIGSAANQWNGFSMFNLKSNGKALNGFDSEGQPIIIQNRAYVPLYMLRQANFQVTWDADTRSVDVSDPSPLSEAKIAEISRSVGKVIVYKEGKFVVQGSGFMIPGGIFITNCHIGCVGDSMNITMDGRTYTTHGEYLFKNEKTDVFGVKLDVLTAIPISNEPARIGTHVEAIGYPLGVYMVTRGWIGATNPTDGVTRISTSSMLSHGSSGCPILNENGEVIGVATGIYEGTVLDVSTPFSYAQDELDKLK